MKRPETLYAILIGDTRFEGKDTMIDQAKQASAHRALIRSLDDLIQAASEARAHAYNRVGGHPENAVMPGQALENAYASVLRCQGRLWSASDV